MKLKNNIIIFYIISFLESCIFLIPIWYFFFVNYLNFWIASAILINVFSWLISLLFEVHSWVWADRFGRKKFYMFWILSSIIWFSFYLWAGNLYFFIISSIFIWIWYAFTSGNLEALIHDNLEENWKVKEYEKIQSNQYIILFSWRAFSSLLAWYLFFYNELYPALATIICYFIAFFLIFFIKPPKQKISQEKTDFKHIKKAILYLKENKKMLFLIVFLWFFFSGIWNIYWFTYQPYLESIWINLKDIWIVYFFISIFSAFWSYIIKKLWNKIWAFSMLNFMFLWLIFISFLFSFLDNIFWVIPIILLSILFGFVMILWNTYLISNSLKTHKSTILSIFSFSSSIWYFLFWIISWYMVELFSLQNVYNLLPFLILMVFISWFLYFKKLCKNSK